MGRRDFGHREVKKQKKDNRKLPQISISPSPINVEIIKKKRKREEEEAG